MTDFDRDASRVSRRKLLQAGAGAAALGAIPGALQRAAQAQSGFDWKKFKGEKIEVLLVKSPRGDILTKYHKEFEDLTGIAVGSEMIPEQQQRQKAVIEFNSGNPSFDVIAISYHVQKRQFAKNNWLADLRPMMNDKSLTNPDLDFNDFAKGGLNYAVEPDGRVNSVPFNLDPWVVYYNKELFDAKGVAYPKTFAEMLDAAAKLNDPGKGVAGFVGRGLKNANVPVWTSFVLGYGGGFGDTSGKLMTDRPEAIEGAKMYQALLGKYGPPGVAGFNWNESQSLYLQWASNKENQTRILQAAAGAPVRNSAYTMAQKSSDFKAPKEWVECMLASAAIAQPGLPIIAPVTEFRDVFGIALTNMINGADPVAELKKATADFQPVLDKSEKA